MITDCEDYITVLRILVFFRSIELYMLCNAHATSSMSAKRCHPTRTKTTA